MSGWNEGGFETDTTPADVAPVAQPPPEISFPEIPPTPVEAPGPISVPELTAEEDTIQPEMALTAEPPVEVAASEEPMPTQDGAEVCSGSDTPDPNSAVLDGDYSLNSIPESENDEVIAPEIAYSSAIEVPASLEPENDRTEQAEDIKDQNSSERVLEYGEGQQANIERFISKLPANAKESGETINFYDLPNDGVAVQGTSMGRVPGSYAVYEKQIDESGNTLQYTKTAYDPEGRLIHVKDKITGQIIS